MYRFNSIQLNNSASILISPTAYVQVNSLVVSGGSISNNHVLESNSTFVLQGGSLTGSGQYVAKSTFQWLSGSFGGAGNSGQMIVQGNGTISGAQDKNLSWWTLINQGSLAWTYGKLSLLNGSLLQNTGSLLQNTGSLQAGNLSTTLQLINGTLANTGSGLLTLVGSVNVSSIVNGTGGAIQVASGALTLTSGGRLCGCGSTASLAIAAGTTVRLTSTAALALSAGVSVSGSGSLVVDTAAVLTSAQTRVRPRHRRQLRGARYGQRDLLHGHPPCSVPLRRPFRSTAAW